MAALRTLEDLLKHEINELYLVESQLFEVMPKMVEKASDQLLKMALENHLQQTKIQRQRLDNICQGMEIERKEEYDMSPIKGMIKLSMELMADDATPEVIDAGLIAVSQKIELSRYPPMVLPRTLRKGSVTWRQPHFSGKRWMSRKWPIPNLMK